MSHSCNMRTFADSASRDISFCQQMKGGHSSEDAAGRRGRSNAGDKMKGPASPLRLEDTFTQDGLIYCNESMTLKATFTQQH